VYALGCVAYEIMTGQVLFDAPTEMAMIAAHIGHDGEPFGVSALARDPELRPFAAFLGRCLRQDPRQRASVPELRRELREVSASLGERAWPLQVPSDAPF
jgi:serine/threonine protein kinase